MVETIIISNLTIIGYLHDYLCFLINAKTTTHYNYYFILTIHILVILNFQHKIKTIFKVCFVNINYPKIIYD